MGQYNSLVKHISIVIRGVFALFVSAALLGIAVTLIALAFQNPLIAILIVLILIFLALI